MELLDENSETFRRFRFHGQVLHTRKIVHHEISTFGCVTVLGLCFVMNGSMNVPLYKYRKIKVDE